ncbi:MAG: sulfatase-like hydrolase/transferase [Planctomycetota bacterium]
MRLPTPTAAGLLAIFLGGVFCHPSAADALNKPNVVIFFTDDQGTLDANCYGSTDLHTPATDELAATGVRFTQAYSHTVCCPARALLFTGRHPQRSGIVSWTQQGPRDAETGQPNLPLSEVTLAEALKGAGYRTALFGKWHLGSKLGHGPTDQGFDTFFGHLGGFIDNYRHYFLHGRGFHDLYEDDTEVFRRGEYFPDMTTRRAVEYIEACQDAPFFMVVAFNIPHYPEQSDPKFRERYKNLEMPRRSYAEMVSTVDDRMGIILDKLDELGLREKTIVIFMSDNGHSAEDKAPIDVDDHTSGFPRGHYYSAHGGGGNTGKWLGHKGQFLEGGIRVPAIISYPAALPQAIVRDQAITAADWYPTVLELCHVPLPDVTLDGKSVLPLIRSADAPSPHKVMHWGWAAGWAVREGPWKLIGRKDQAQQLVNLDDPEPEAVNHINEKPETVRRLKRLHDEWLEETSMSLSAVTSGAAAEDKRLHIRIRGIYGGVPVELIDQGKMLKDYGVNAIFMGSGGLSAERISLLKKHGARVFAEFNTMHVASYLKDHPDAAPIGADGKVCPAPHGWQGVCPTHPGYRESRMDAFRKILSDFEIDGIWLDYHHSHASWERAVPDVPDTCFCERCITRFEQETKTDLRDDAPPRRARLLLDKYRDKWVQWRCDVFTDWVREFRSILDDTRPSALLGTFHCPWTDTEQNGALRNKLAIDLKAQAEYVDVFSIMPYHARFGHHDDPSWIYQQTAWLGRHLGVKGEPGERHKIWPIVQLSDWGETVPVHHVRSILDHGTLPPATGVMVFNWGSLRRQMEKVDEMSDFYRAIRP